MRIFALACGAILLGTLCGSLAQGDASSTYDGLQSPPAAEPRSVEFDYGSYQTSDALSTQAPSGDSAASSGSRLVSSTLEFESDVSCCDSCGGGCGCQAGCCAGRKPWTLPQPCLLQAMGIRVGGWLEQGITFNGNGPADGFNGPMFTNDFDGEYQMNQFWLYLDRPVNTGGYGWDIGGHFDIMYGTDWRYGIQFGLEDRFQNVADSYGIVIPQLYAEIAVNDLSVKLGHFAGILGYEVVPSVANPFYSHAYEYAAVPQLVTGAMADYKLNELFSIQAGAHRGWMMWDDVNQDMDFMGGVRFNSFDKRTSIAYAVSTGPQDPAGNQNRFASTLVLKHQVSKAFQYVLVHNLGVENDVALLNNRDAEWYGLSQYFLYTINPCWSANLRFEWFRDDDGVIVHGLGSAVPPRRGWAGFGYPGNFYELTAGVTWRPSANLMVRPEFRWDWYDGQSGPVGAGLPFGDFDRDNQFTFGTDLILTF